MQCISGNNCCVARQLFGFNNHKSIYDMDATTKMWNGPEDAVTTVVRETGYDNPNHKPDASQILWSVAWDQPGMGQNRMRSTVMDRYNAMCRYIKKHNLGTVTKVPTVINPNHDSFVKTAVWNIDKEGMYSWADKKGITNEAYDEYYSYLHEDLR